MARLAVHKLCCRSYIMNVIDKYYIYQQNLFLRELSDVILISF